MVVSARERTLFARLELTSKISIKYFSTSILVNHIGLITFFSTQGLSKKLKVTKKMICPNCKGVGALDKSDVAACRQCDGSGRQLRMIKQVREPIILTFVFSSSFKNSKKKKLPMKILAHQFFFSLANHF